MFEGVLITQHISQKEAMQLNNLSLEIHLTIWDQKVKINDLNPYKNYKKKTNSSFQLMSGRGNATKKKSQNLIQFIIIDELACWLIAF